MKEGSEMGQPPPPPSEGTKIKITVAGTCGMFTLCRALC